MHITAQSTESAMHEICYKCKGNAMQLGQVVPFNFNHSKLSFPKIPTSIHYFDNIKQMRKSRQEFNKMKHYISQRSDLCKVKSSCTTRMKMRISANSFDTAGKWEQRWSLLNLNCHKPTLFFLLILLLKKRRITYNGRILKEWGNIQMKDSFFFPRVLCSRTL